MKILSVKNPKWVDASHTAIDLTVTFKDIGTVPFTASADDVEPHGAALFADAVAGKYGAVAAYVPPTRFATVPAALAGIQADCDALAAKKRGEITKGISPAEMASWSIKRAEAMAYQVSGTAGDAPMLQVEATARGVTLADLAAKVMAKAALLSQAEALIAGTNGKHNDALAALAAAPGTTVANMLAYDMTTGWPL
ncbi:MAG: hypothetical protein ABIK08_11320 [Pseudomonadota bacterium]